MCLVVPKYYVQKSEGLCVLQAKLAYFERQKSRKKRDFSVFRELPDGVPGHQKNQNLAGMCLLVSKDYVQKSECSSCLQAKLR
jgi:hypothetical protein